MIVIWNTLTKIVHNSTTIQQQTRLYIHSQEEPFP